MKIRLTVLIVLFCLYLFPSVEIGEHPIIFIHGIDAMAIPNANQIDENGYYLGSLFSWHPIRQKNGIHGGVEVDSTALLKIIGYRGYCKGTPFDCTKESQPIDVMPNVVYNFSFYNPDGTRGVIGGGEDVNGEPIYVPEDEEYQEYYRSSFENGQWAKNVAEFIKKVYTILSPLNKS